MSVTIRPVPGTDPKARGQRFFVDFVEQWSQFFALSEQNWLDFTWLKCQGEVAAYKRAMELEIGFLGLNWTFTYLYNDAFNRELMSAREKIEEEIKATTGAGAIHDPFGVLDAVDKESRP